MSSEIRNIESQIRAMSSNISNTNKQLPIIQKAITKLNDCYEGYLALRKNIQTNFTVDSVLFEGELLDDVGDELQKALANLNESKSVISSKVRKYNEELRSLKRKKERLEDEEEKQKKESTM